jgi:nicotinate (nicotinamide) nucleotide adenylyltransferase
MQRKIAIFGGSFNPPGNHHREIVLLLQSHFDGVIVVPCGDRPDKPTTGTIEREHRKAMAHLAFDGISPKVRVDDFDLSGTSFTPTVDLQTRYTPLGEIWHIVGSDLIHGGEHGMSDIQNYWKNGRELWRSLNFAVLLRGSEALNYKDLPPHRRLFVPGADGASKDIRHNLANGLPIDGLVSRAIEEYVRRNGLYQKLAA